MAKYVFVPGKNLGMFGSFRFAHSDCHHEWWQAMVPRSFNGEFHACPIRYMMISVNLWTCTFHKSRFYRYNYSHLSKIRLWLDDYHKQINFVCVSSMVTPDVWILQMFWINRHLLTSVEHLEYWSLDVSKCLFIDMKLKVSYRSIDTVLHPLWPPDPARDFPSPRGTWEVHWFRRGGFHQKSPGGYMCDYVCIYILYIHAYRSSNS